MNLAGIFSDRAVLQHGMKVPVWGAAPEGSAVVVEFGGRRVSATTNSSGRWRVDIGPYPRGVCGNLTVTAGKERMTARDVVTGEVWLCAGQSNIQMPVRGAWNGNSEAATGFSTSVHHFKVGIRVGHASNAAIDGIWERSTDSGAGDFSAVGYFFAREVAADVRCPVGIINVSKGGSPIESWLSAQALGDSRMARRLRRAWIKRSQAAPLPKTGRRISALPPFEDIERRMSPFGPGGFGEPGCIYNGMMAPLIPYAIRGVIWYQGEANTSSDFAAPGEYGRLLQCLIRDLRRGWRNRNLPFYFVQLPSNTLPERDLTGQMWARVREAQRTALEMAGTRMVITTDLDDRDRIHPRAKQEVGKRLADRALTDIYRTRNADISPYPQQAWSTTSEVVIEFKSQGGLVANGCASVHGFEIERADGELQEIEANILGNRVVLLVDRGLPVAFVRYGWRQDPSGANLCSRGGLPACPFRIPVSVARRRM